MRRQRGEFHPSVSAQYRQRLGDSRVFDAAPAPPSTRTAREVAKGRPSGRTHEIQRLIGRSLRAVIDLAALGERSVILDCDVIQADGGTRVASITGAYVALARAVPKQMVRFKMIAKSPLIGAVAAISVGMHRGEALLDLCYEEDSQAEVGRQCGDD